MSYTEYKNMKCVKCNADIEQDAQFCPYCGTRVVYTRCCTKCGKPLDEDSDFCPYCGTKQDSVNTESEQIEEVVQPQTTISVQELETVDPSKNQIEELPQEVNENGKVDDVVTSNPEHNEPDSELPHESKNSSKKWLLIVGVILLLGILGGGGYYFMTNKDGGSSYIVETDSIAEIGDSVNTTDDEAAMMDALAARNNAMEEAFGVLALHKCPQKIDGLSVELAMDDDYGQSVKITKDGKFLQELKGDFYQGSPMVFDNSMVYYVDANFDEYTDIFIGTGDDRTDNTILLWNSDKNIFEKYGKIGEPSLMNPYFSPSENAIYECGQNGFYSFGYSKSVWKDGKLVTQEHLDEILFREGFDYKTYNEGLDYKRSKKYALFDSNYKLIMETNEIDELPNKWAEVIREENI